MERRFLLRPRMRRNRNKTTEHMMMAKEKPQKYEYTKVICILQMAFLYVNDSEVYAGTSLSSVRFRRVQLTGGG